MDRSRPSTSDSSQDQNPFTANSYSQPPSPHHNHHALAIPDSSSPSAGNSFPFYSGSAANSVHASQNMFQRRSQGPAFQPMSRPGTTQSQHSNNGDAIMFNPRNHGGHRTPPTASYLGPPRTGSMTPRESAFAAPPVRMATPSVSESAYRKPLKAVPFKSTALYRDENGSANISKPWLDKKDSYATISWALTWSIMLLAGLGGSALTIYFSWRNFPHIPNFCLVMEDNFDTFNGNMWNREADLGGFG